MKRLCEGLLSANNSPAAPSLSGSLWRLACVQQQPWKHSVGMSVGMFSNVPGRMLVVGSVLHFAWPSYSTAAAKLGGGFAAVVVPCISSGTHAEVANIVMSPVLLFLCHSRCIIWHSAVRRLHPPCQACQPLRSPDSAGSISNTSALQIRTVLHSTCTVGLQTLLPVLVCAAQIVAARVNMAARLEAVEELLPDSIQAVPMRSQLMGLGVFSEVQQMCLTLEMHKLALQVKTSPTPHPLIPPSCSLVLEQVS